MLSEEIRLDDQSGPRFAIRASQNHRHQIAAFHTQPSVSATSAIHARVSASSGSFVSDKDSRSHFLR